MAVANMVSVSGGKDSEVTMLLALLSGAENLHLVFADTGHEAPSTYAQIEYLSGVSRRLGGPDIQTVKADFSAQIARKREFVRGNWVADLVEGKPGAWVREAKTPEGTPPPGGLVLDPFMGSGSTGKGALREGFTFIGCELSPEYVEIARERLDNSLHSARIA